MENYNLVITGFRPGVEQASAKASLAALFRATPAQIDHICARFPYTAKKGIAAEVARKYQISLDKAGFSSEAAPEGPAIDLPSASGGRPAHFGWIRVKTTFMMVAVKDPKPSKVFIGGIDWGDRRQWFIGPDEGQGVALLDRLALAGCQVPPELRASQVKAASQV